MFPPSLDSLAQFFVAPVQKSVDSDISGSAVEQSSEFDLCLLRCHLEYAEDAHALDCNVTFEVCLFHQVYIVIINVERVKCLEIFSALRPHQD